AAVMKGRVAPRGIVHPGPAPGRNPSPVAVVVGSPAGRYCRWHPNLSIFGVMTPDTGLIQILVADPIRRDVSHRTRALFAAVAFRAPIVEIVAVARIHFVDI